MPRLMRAALLRLMLPAVAVSSFVGSDPILTGAIDHGVDLGNDDEAAAVAEHGAASDISCHSSMTS